jgi:hypothetical protein
MAHAVKFTVNSAYDPAISSSFNSNSITVAESCIAENYERLWNEHAAGLLFPSEITCRHHLSAYANQDRVAWALLRSSVLVCMVVQGSSGSCNLNEAGVILIKLTDTINLLVVVCVHLRFMNAVLILDKLTLKLKSRRRT